MSVRSRLANILPARAARYAGPIAILAVAVLLFAGLAVAALVSPSTVGIQAARVSETRALPDSLQQRGLAEKDSDHDGLSDSLENYLYGTDPNNWNSSGLGIPDGWLVQYGFDPLSPLTRDARGVAPPSDKLPPAYAAGYPLKFTPPLADYYDYAKPASYDPTKDAQPWWRPAQGAPEPLHAAPNVWDQSGKGIPTGWLLYYKLDPKNTDLDKVAPGSKGNLTVREAFEHNTDPLALDSDHDGLTDWDEIHVTQTDPAKFSSSGSGIADGWLIHYGLDAFDRQVGSQDADLDGLTNAEEFRYSFDAFQAAAANDITVLYKQGLDPLDWQTSHSGIPDGWYVRYGLNPFGAEGDRVIARSADFPELKTYTPPGEPPLPDINMTVRDAYQYGRPSDWNETVNGVWWGGTNPANGDTDNDGLPDVIEMRGWYGNVTTDVGPNAKPRVAKLTSNPLEADSDGDGLPDGAEYRGSYECGSAPGTDAQRSFPLTDPRNRDTAFSGLTDLEKVCGVVRGGIKYDIKVNGAPGLDPTKADSAGDYMRDGARVDFWHQRYVQYKANPKYTYNGSLYKTVFEWTDKYARFGGMTHDQVLEQFRPDGDVDGDGIANALDSDASGGLQVEKFAAPNTPKSTKFLESGPKIDPSLYRLVPGFASAIPRPAADPANPDTDGDGLPDSWEIQYGTFDPTIGNGKGGWNLDPTKADSNGNGVTDDKENNDGDTVTWYAYKHAGSSFERTTNTWDFNNMLEFLAKTDPNQLSSAGDGIGDGWKAFWGSHVADDTYPNLIGARDPRVGDLALEHASEIQNALANSPIAQGGSLKGLSAKSTGYDSFIDLATDCVPSSPDLRANLGPDEVIPQTNPCYNGPDFAGKEVHVLRVQGVYRLLYKTEAALGTNPFMADTDGDGVPDAYEAKYSVRSAGGTAFPDPVSPDGDRVAPTPPGEAPSPVPRVSLASGCKPSAGICTIETFTRDGQTFGVGVDPHAANGDTDHGGLQDSVEVQTGSSPLDPTDDRADSTKDSDHDGVPDVQELAGWGKGVFGKTVRTDPNSPDTDHDGLLDGPTRAITYTRAPSPTDAAARSANADAELWCSMGLAHTTQLPNAPAGSKPVADICGPGMAGRVTQNLILTFLGENDTRDPLLFPDDPNSVGKAVPDGYVAYYANNLTGGNVDPADYNACKPSWWTESTMGVWWWGRSPGQTAGTSDLDRDGLDDTTGEDTFPCTLRGENLTRSAGDAPITDPNAIAAWVKAGANATDILQRAQSVGDGAGDPAYARAAAERVVDADGVYALEDRAKLAVQNVALPNGTLLSKGVAFPVTGNVVLDARNPGSGQLLEGSETARVGVANRTVFVGMFSPSAGRVFAVGFTDANGAFNLSVNLTSSVTVRVPKDIVFRGVEDQTLVLPANPGAIIAGDLTNGLRNQLVVWVLNTSTNLAPQSGQYGNYTAWLNDTTGHGAARTTHATAFAAATPIPVTIHSDTRFTTTIGPVVENGQTLVGDIKLTDASGAPLSDRNVKLRWTGAGETPLVLSNASTDRDGILNVTNLNVRASVARSDPYTLFANFTSSDPNLASVETPFAIQVRDPTLLVANLDRTGATVGDSVVLTGTLATRSVTLASGAATSVTPLANAPVKITLGGLDTAAHTDDHGQLNLRLAVPGTLPAGQSVITLAYAGSDSTSPASVDLQLAIKRTANVAGLTPLEGPRTISVTMRGKLVDNAGEGFAGEIDVISNGVKVATGASDDRGAFGVTVPLAKIPLGANALRVRFPGDAAHAPAENITSARVTSTTTLALAGVPPVVVRGSEFGITMLLTDDQSNAVPGAAIAVAWRGDRQLTVVTDQEGRASALVRTNTSETPSVANVGIEYVPQPTSVYQPSSADASTRLVKGVTLTFDGASVHRGPIAMIGTLVDDEGRPLPGSAVTFRFAGQPFGDARTARNGTFELDRTLSPDAPLGAFTVNATYAGTPTLAGATREVTWSVKSPLVPAFTTLGPLVRGEPAPIQGRVTDDAGAPLDTTLHVLLNGKDIGIARVTNGAVQASVPVPQDATRGAGVLTLHADATEKYDAYDRALPIIVKIRPKVDVELPSIAVRGFSFGGNVLLRDDKGQPLRNTSFVYSMNSGKESGSGQTDADGRSQLAAVAPLQGDAALVVTVRGGNDVVAADYRVPSLHVVGPATPIGYAALILGVLVVLAIIAVIVIAAVLRRRQLEDVRDILEETIRDLLAGNEYAGTIFLAYRRLSAHLARHGFAEKATDTPREFATGVRKALPVGATPLRALIRLFEEAKYSDHAIGTRERDEAVENLSQVRAELDRILGRKVKEAAS